MKVVFESTCFVNLKSRDHHDQTASRPNPTSWSRGDIRMDSRLQIFRIDVPTSRPLRVSPDGKLENHNHRACSI